MYEDEKGNKTYCRIRIYIHIHFIDTFHRLYAQESCFIMQKFLLITTLDNLEEWPFTQYHETALHVSRAFLSTRD